MNAAPVKAISIPDLAIIPVQEFRCFRNEEPEMSPADRAEALKFGRSNNLIDRITDDYEALGLVGEHHNKLLCYLAAVSRRLDTDSVLSVLVLSSSGAGKSFLQDKTLKLCPEEDVVAVSSLTDKALFYRGEDLSHKILALAEAAGMKNAYQIRTLISEGELSVESVTRAGGQMTTTKNTVKGPCSVFLTTTDPTVDPELASRMWVLGVDESKDQTRRILEVQRDSQSLEGIIRRAQRDHLVSRHHNFQRLLRDDLRVVNPFAGELFWNDDRLTARRNQPKYLNLCKAIAFLRQMQKPVNHYQDGSLDFDYIEVDMDDIRLATALATEILGTDLNDLSVPARDLLAMADGYVGLHAKSSKERHIFTFTRRELREFTGWGKTRLATHLNELRDFELIVKQSGKRNCLEHYRLLYDAEQVQQNGGKVLAGLKSVE